MQVFKQPVFYIIIVVAIAIAAGWTYFSNKNKAPAETPVAEEQKVSNLTNLDPKDFDSVVKEEYALAKAKAVEANAGNELSSIEVTVSADLNAEKTNTRYIFSSPTDTINNWMITISTLNQSYIRALIPKDDYAGELTKIDTGNWKYNYVTALQLAEQNSGLSWREQNTLTNLKLTLKNSSTGSLIWIAEYNSSDSNNTVKLDAKTGKVVEE